MKKSEYRAKIHEGDIEIVAMRKQLKKLQQENKMLRDRFIKSKDFIVNQLTEIIGGR